MLDALKRHPFAVEAHFRWSLVLAYALPRDVLQPLVPDGLVLDTYDDLGILAVALVQTEHLRPKGLPKALGRDFFLSGYRIFVRLDRPDKDLRGLRILRSDTDKRMMVALGNTFTHYGYRLAKIATQRDGDRLTVDVRTPEQEADLHVEADLREATSLPPTSPFRSLEDAKHFAGPLPYTFDRDAPTGKIVAVRGLRSSWSTRPVTIVSQTSSWLARPGFSQARLANAFFVEDVPYSWKPGVLE
ncbi:MAG: DUF2071 domain-containing protein [Polyangia bacterium]